MTDSQFQNQIVKKPAKVQRYLTKRNLLIFGSLLLLGAGFFIYHYVRNQALTKPFNRPTVAVQGLRNGQVVSGLVPVLVDAQSADGIEEVRFYLDNKAVNVDQQAAYCLGASGTADPKVCPGFDTTKLPRGKHILTIFTTSKKGATSRVLVNFEVRN